MSKIFSNEIKKTANIHTDNQRIHLQRREKREFAKAIWEINLIPQELSALVVFSGLYF